MRRLVFFILFLIFFCPIGIANSPELEIRINIPEFILRVYQSEEIIYEAPVGVGRPGHETPIGEFIIINKIKDPTWYPKNREPIPPGQTNPLGSYWLGLSKKGYGIHGNINSTSIGSSVSLGCIRMYNNDIELIYHLVEKGTRVKIYYQTIFLIKEGEDLKFRLLEDIYGYGTNNIFTFLNLIKDKEIKDKIFIPYLIYLLKTKEAGIYPVPHKVSFIYQNYFYKNIGFRFGNVIYIDPRAIPKLMQKEKELKIFLKNKERYITLDELESKLINHRIISHNKELIQIYSKNDFKVRGE
ncbi:hypothetical protein BBF96_10575 [Anoxybacter fermentans]|uniref:L,D-TPase catalytic domain-containing protein n=1 Tax=Anoxybacter fermentans TaxID=1323375 RepID=A0A3Q9HQZ2_9FIRM|nr:L,D-transpeptidase [Anoxybacter fermentans]AZR73791.1 hypothetical protein BBF96_10575 [Anoxybacter fermentans]